MSDPLQPELPAGRSPAAIQALGNRSGVVTAPDVEEADDAMEKMFQEQFGRPPSAADDIPDKDRENNEVDDDPDGSAAANALDDAADDAADDTPDTAGDPPDTSDTPPPPPDAEPVKRTLLDELVDKPADKPVDTTPIDPYDEHKLPGTPSERTRETFDQLKKAAREREAAAREEAKKAREEAEALRKQLEEAGERPPPEELTKELEELRTFRRAYDTENDPEFRQKFESRREANENSIYETLKKGGLKDTVLEQLKALPYDQRVDNIARWAEKLSPRDKLLVSSRLADNENIELERAKALEEIKATAHSVLEAARGPSAEEQEKQFVEGVITALKPVLPSVDILQPKEVPAAAAPKEREQIEEHNKLVARHQTQLLELIQDNSPATKGVLALAGVLAPHYKAQVKSLQTEIKSLQEQLAKIKKAGSFSRVSGSSAPAKVGPEVLDMGAEEALDNAWRMMQS